MVEAMAHTAFGSEPVLVGAAELPDADAFMNRAADVEPFAEYGRATRVVGLVIEAVGLDLALGEICRVQSLTHDATVLAEVVGFHDKGILLMPLGELDGVHPGSAVEPLGRAYGIDVGQGMLGRVLDGFGRPLDGLAPLPGGSHREVRQKAPTPLERVPVDSPLSTGVRAIDGLTTVGRGQRVGIFAGPGVGKSTLMRKLTGAEVLVEDRLFATLDTTTRKWELPEFGRDVLLSDTVGFIRKLPHSLVASFNATLSEAQEADLLLHVVDGSSPQLESDLEVVEETLERIGCSDQPRFLVLNKFDQLGEDRQIDVQQYLRDGDGFLVSAVSGAGLDGLIDRIITEVQRGETDCEYEFPHGRGDLANKLRQLGNVLEERYEESGMIVRVRLGISERDQFERQLVAEGLREPDPIEDDRR